MRKRHIILPIAAAVMIFFSISAGAADKLYKNGVISDYQFYGNDVSLYSQKILDDMFFNYATKSQLFYLECDSERAEAELDFGAVDFLSMLPYNDKFNERFDYTDKPVAEGFLGLLTPKSSNLYYEDYRSFRGVKIALLKNSYFEDRLLQFAAENGFDYNAVYFDTIEDILKAVESGAADAFLTPVTGDCGDMQLIAKLGSFDYYCAVKKGDTAMLEVLNNVINSQAEDAPFYIQEGYKAVFDIPYRNVVALTENDYRAAKNQGSLRVFVPGNRYPMVSYNIRSGTYEGIYINLLQQIAENAGLEITYVADDLNDIDETLNSIILGKADAILAVSGSYQGLISATKPYTTLSFMPVGKKSEEDIDQADPHSVGIIDDDAWIITYLSDKYPKWTVKQYRSFNSMLRAASGGEIDFALVASPDMHSKMSLIAHPKLEIKDFYIDIPVCLGISDVTSNSYVVTMLDGIISNTALDGEAFENKVYNLSNTYVPTFRDLLYSNRIELFIILIIIAVVIALLYLRVRYFRRLARYDGMTHIYNGRYFFQSANKLLTKNPGRKYLLASIDAKKFKLVNDRFGAEVGDQILIQIADEIKSIFKDKALFARLQGDSFVVLAEDTENSRALLEKLNEADIYVHDSTNYHVHLKTGVCEVTDYNRTAGLGGYIDKANIAKQGTGETSQNDLSYFTDKTAERLERETEIEVEMVKSLERGDFVAWYQPKYSLADNSIIGAEALVRWKHKEKGMISPALFVPVLERNGFITEVDFAVYEQVMKMQKARLNAGKKVVTVSINVSRCHVTDKDFADKLDALVEKYGVPKKYVEMEITESIFTGGDTSANELVYELKKRGFPVSMDDFGSGYSSLNLLRVMPIDTLKIDKVFIDDIETSERSQSIIEEIIAMAKRIDVRTICEGIETEKQRDILKNAGCDMAQGYFYSKPLTENDFKALLDKEGN